MVVVLQLAPVGSRREYYLTQLTMSAYYALVVLGLCLLMGYAGQISLGHAGFFAIGGYTSAVLTTLNLGAAARCPVVALVPALGLLVDTAGPLRPAMLLTFRPGRPSSAAVLVTGADRLA